MDVAVGVEPGCELFALIAEVGLSREDGWLAWRRIHGAALSIKLGCVGGRTRFRDSEAVIVSEDGVV